MEPAAGALRRQPGRALTLLVPVVGLVSAALLLGERLVPAQWLGGAVVMAGLLLNVFGGRLAARLALV